MVLDRPIGRIHVVVASKTSVDNLRRTFWSRGRNIAAEISLFGRKVALQCIQSFTSFALAHFVAKHHTVNFFANIPSLPLVLEISLFQL